MSNWQYRLPDGPFAPTWESLEGYQVPRWYVDGKFGIFIHWGLYAVPAFGSEWYPRRMYEQGSAEFEHHRKKYGDHRQFGYKDFIPLFKAERYDPAAWAALFRASGARFVVPVAEHHDGFSMYDNSFSEWSAVKMGPKRDLVGALADAVRAQGLIFGVSSHRAEHWWFFDGGMRFPSDVQDSPYAGLYAPAQLRDTQPNDAFLEDWLARSCELIDRYRPQLFWFDWWIQQPAFEPYLRKFAAYYYNRAAEWGRGVAINYKYDAFPDGTAVFDVERGQLADIRQLFWQTDTAVAKNSWGYIDGLQYKEAGGLIGDLADIVSKNGALLLNVGPRADGTIPEGDEKLLREIGGWLAVNGDAIYDSRPWTVFGEGATEIVEGAFTDTRRGAYTAADIRFTTRGDVLYATVLAWPEKPEILVKSLGTDLRLYNRRIASVTMPGVSGALKASRTGRGLRVHLPAERPNPHGFTLKITPER